jgi:hypothetical protein
MNSAQFSSESPGIANVFITQAAIAILRGTFGSVLLGLLDGGPGRVTVCPCRRSWAVQHASATLSVATVSKCGCTGAATEEFSRIKE